MKILLTGQDGQLGSVILNVASKNIVNNTIKLITFKDFDITDYFKVDEVLKDIQPDWVLNCASMTDVDACEDNESVALNINGYAVGNLARVCKKYGSTILHISSDYVFNGKNDRPYTEQSNTDPITAYGRSKLLGESEIISSGVGYIIVRTSWLYSIYGKNFFKTIRNIAKEKGRLFVVNDQIGSPTNAEELVMHLFTLISENERGLFHCSGKDPCTWFDFATEIVKLCKISCIVEPCTTEQSGRKAKRPKYSYLENIALQKLGIDNMKNWKESLSEFISSNNFF